MGSHVVLYDSDCGLCIWTLAKLLAWDRRRRLRPVALQDPEADALLDGIDEQRKMASWHLVQPGGQVSSGGAAVAPLAELLPGGGVVARLAAAVPGLTARLYDWVASNRGRLGRLLPKAALRRASRRVEGRR
jgi:predicted DCC family thiol-disulfide oxidoreductase YuxK